MCACLSYIDLRKKKKKKSTEGYVCLLILHRPKKKKKTDFLNFSQLQSINFSHSLIFILYSTGF